LRLLGYASEALDRLDEEIGRALTGTPVAEPEQPPAAAAAQETDAAAPVAEPEQPPAAAAAQETDAAAPVAEPEQPAAAAAAQETDPAAPVAEPGPASSFPMEELGELAESPSGDSSDDDLSTITAALESELFADEDEAVVPEAQSEQSLEDVFSAFKKHVAEEVSTDDFQTHYDLGIAYKEMGLMDEAIGEFHVAVKSSEMNREASIMLAICHRERREINDAAEWYRRALQAPGGDPESSAELRYELAEVLLEAGEVEQALEAFRALLDADPGYRDVRERIEQLEARSTP
jgi:tetratricopeptide (TPR) repeat protein